MAIVGIHNPPHPPVAAEPPDAPVSSSGQHRAGVEPKPTCTQGSPSVDTEQRARSAAG